MINYAITRVGEPRIINGSLGWAVYVHSAWYAIIVANFGTTQYYTCSHRQEFLFNDDPEMTGVHAIKSQFQTTLFGFVFLYINFRRKFHFR